jgi:Uma2 family endonuclease
MATATTTPTEPIKDAPASSLRPYVMTVDVYDRIVAAGVFGDKSRIFLWNGQLVEKVADMTKNPPHIFAAGELDELLGDLVRGQGYFVQQEQPVVLGNRNEPEPDLKCVRGRRRDYLGRKPTAADCPLVVEIADSSLRDDRVEMLQVYAAGGIPSYWIVNLPARRIDAYTGPSGPADPPGYTEHRAYGPDESVPVVLDGRELGRIAVRDVLP